MMQSDECNEIGRIVGSELDVDVEGLNDIRFNGSATHGATKCHFDRPCSASINSSQVPAEALLEN